MEKEVLVDKQPMDIIKELREVLKPLGYEIFGFDYPINGFIDLKIAYPMMRCT